MSTERRPQVRRVAASPLIAAFAALLVVLSLVVPVLAGEGPTKLSQPNVTPRAGTTATTLTFTVEYRNREGSAPDHVSVTIGDSIVHAMTSDGSTNWHDGVVYTWKGKLPPGTWEIRFTAADTRKFTDRVGAGSVTIAAPAPTPTPTPKPTPDPTPKPTPTPDPGSGSSGSGSGSGGSGSGDTGAGSGSGGGSTGGGTITGPGGGETGGSTGGDSPAGGGEAPGAGTGTGTGDLVGGDSGTHGGSPADGTIGLPGRLGSSDGAGVGPTWGATDAPGHPGWIGWSGGSTAEPGATKPQTMPGGTADTPAGPGTSGTGAGSWTAGSGSEGPGWGALASALRGLGVDDSVSITAIPMLIGTAGAMTMTFAFAIFGKKRRDETQPAPDEVLEANAARGVDLVPGGEVAQGVVSATAIPAPLDPELSMPRWRRPSLREARKADPTRSAPAVHVPMTFEGGIVNALAGRERRLIRYAMVRLLDAPDELRSAEIGALGQGDEVQLLERSGTYWLVLCPNGQQGWIHKMTLGDVISDTAPSQLREIDDDVLTAFLTARARA